MTVKRPYAFNGTMKLIASWIGIVIMLIAFFVSVGVFINRTEALESTADDHEIRIRNNETVVTRIDTRLDNIESDISEIKENLRND